MSMPSALTDHLGFWLRAVSNYVSHSFAARLAGRDVTVAEWVMMRALYGNPPLAPSRLAGQMGMTRGAVTKLADRLIAKSLVARKADATDGRAQTLALTPKGLKLVPDLAALADRNDTECFALLTRSERKTLETLLKHMAAKANLTTPPLD